MIIASNNKIKKKNRLEKNRVLETSGGNYPRDLRDGTF